MSAKEEFDDGGFWGTVHLAHVCRKDAAQLTEWRNCTATKEDREDEQSRTMCTECMRALHRCAEHAGSEDAHVCGTVCR